MEETDIVSMSDSEFDGYVENLNQDEAKSGIDKVKREAAINPKHPYIDSHSFEHERTVGRVSRLFKAAHTGDEPRTNITIAAEEALAEQAEKKNVLVEQAKDDMDFLVEAGFDRSDIPDDLQPYQANALRMQRLNAEGKHTEVVPIMQKELRELRAPAETIQLFDTFTQTNELDPNLKETIFESVLRWIHDARKTQSKG